MIKVLLRLLHIFSLCQCNAIAWFLSYATQLTKIPLYNLLTLKECVCAVRSGQHIFSCFFIYTSFNENKAGGMGWNRERKCIFIAKLPSFGLVKPRGKKKLKYIFIFWSFSFGWLDIWKFACNKDEC